ncbi:hypothetical protein ANN_01295 [Periplaneta americana]|uniref:Uncharacterized protein n=1 Tax=Periplaneta americana TaxID=6978 RepID=A0ABQ8TT62_PERAM|nr:hypothetical protein ANN_01295 [Periplaneta americana]
MFEEKYPDTHVTLHQYRDAFRSRFNLKFGLPRSDICQKCDRYFVQLSNATSAEETRRIDFETNLHHRKAEQACAVLREDIEIARQNNSVVVLCVDMQQVLFSPMLTHSNVFYQRQFSTYNNCVSNAGSGQVTMHLWHEGVADRGASEVASLDTVFCPATHFALIEKQKRIAKVNVPFQWVEVIVAARPTNPFQVTYMQSEDFKNCDTLDKNVTYPKEFKITEAMWLKCSQNDPFSVMCENLMGL